MGDVIYDIAKEYYEGVELSEQECNSLAHYGTPRHSGRYPWGSGDNPYQHVKGFLGQYQELKAKGVKETDIAKFFGYNTTQLRSKVAVETMNAQKIEYDQIKKLSDEGLGATAIGRKLGMSEGTVRSKLKRGGVDTRIESTANALMKAVDEHKYVNVGKGVNYYLGISEDKLTKTLGYLEKKGYKTQTISIPQMSGTSKNATTMLALTKDDVTKRELYDNRDKIRMVGQHSDDGGLTYNDREPIKNISRDRIYVRYGDEGGKEKDGTIEIRRGVEDLDLGQSHYAQVRIGVEGGLYMKGMAMYGDVPKGYDIVYNTNKKSGSPDKDIKDENGFVTKSGVFKTQTPPRCSWI